MVKSSAQGLLTKLDDLFSTQEEREVATQPRVQEISIDLIDEFPNHPFKVRIPKDRISKYFAPGTPAQKIEDTIVKALELYRKRQREQAR